MAVEETMSKEAPSLTSFDLGGIEDMDPSVSDGYHPLYDRECPFEVRFHDSDGPGEGTLEAIKVKVGLLCMYE